MIKSALKQWLKTSTPPQAKVAGIRQKITDIQLFLNLRPDEIYWHKEEASLKQELDSWLAMEEKEVQQKSREGWLKMGDKCTKFFFRAAQFRNYRNDLSMLFNATGTFASNFDDIKTNAPVFFSSLFHQADYQSSFPELIVRKKLTISAQNWLCRPVSSTEVLHALSSMSPNKAPGPDGFNVHFFLHNWDIVGTDFTAAVQNFFFSGRLLKEINHTFITLVPKVLNVKEFGDFRPISCCNTIYKTITKVLSLRLQQVIADLISPNQHAFIQGRHIGDCTLLAHELVKDFKCKFGQRFCIKIDLKKAFDSINREFLYYIMAKMEFPNIWISWIRECISSPTFSVMVNGSPKGFFDSNRGVRQGDPLSPFLFTLVMEFLSIQLDISLAKGRLDPITKQGELCVTHLLFADDLLLFGKANKKTVVEIDRILQCLTLNTGLSINKDKSKVFFSSGCRHAYQLAATLNIPIGTLPIRYLGLPLSIHYLRASNYSVLIDKCKSRLNGWAACSLSFAGRLQLIHSCIMGNLSYWLQSFFFPRAIIVELERICSNFLWNGRMHGWSWKNICRPKAEGGLGLRSIHDLCLAGQLKQTWCFLQNSSMWARFMHSRYLKDTGFWYAQYRQPQSLVWKKLLESRELIFPLLKRVIGDGSDTNLWYDPWLHGRSIVSHIGEEYPVLNAGQHWTVNKILQNGVWHIDLSPLQCISGLIQGVQVPATIDTDHWLWLGDPNGVFSFKSAWNQVRTHYPSVSWFSEVWYPNCTPKFACCVVRALCNRLPTAARLKAINVISSDACVLCADGIETIDHLFFQCPFSAYIWNLARLKLGLQDSSTYMSLAQELLYIKLVFKGKNISYCLSRTAISAVVWSIWKERNSRIFTGVYTNKVMLFSYIMDTVNILLKECKWRVRRRDIVLLDNWNINM